jgi:hypothetical protein
MGQPVGVRLSPSAPISFRVPSLMQATSLSDIFSHPSFLTILATILIVIANIMIGVSMLPKDIRQKRYKLHRNVYWVSLVSLGAFLVVTHRLLGNSLFNYFVMVYFLVVIPLSRKWNVTAHAIIASIGLVLLVGVATFSIL